MNHCHVPRWTVSVTSGSVPIPLKGATTVTTGDREARVAELLREAARLGRAPVRSELTATLVRLGRETPTGPGAAPWEEAYARAIVAEFAEGEPGG
jgi:hypothetical protein